MTRPENIQRELRVRVFNIATGEYDPDCFPSATTDPEDGSFSFSPEEEAMIYEQWTGEKDKHDTRIYENDLMRADADGTEPRKIFQVVMRRNAWALVDYEGVFHMFLASAYHYNVIGNAHDTNIWKKELN